MATNLLEKHLTAANCLYTSGFWGFRPQTPPALRPWSWTPLSPRSRLQSLATPVQLNSAHVVSVLSRPGTPKVLGEMKTAEEHARMQGPKGRKSRLKAESKDGFLWSYSKPPPHPLNDLASAVSSPGPPKGFRLFTLLKMASPDSINIAYHTLLQCTFRQNWNSRPTVSVKALYDIFEE